MEPLLTSFVAAGLAEWGDRTQLLVAALAARYGRPGAVLAGVGAAALASALIASAGGLLVNGLITLRAISLLLAVALLYAGAVGIAARKAPPLADTVKGGAIAGSALAVFLVEFGDKTQFITFAVAAQFNSLLLASLGSAAGVVAASAPAALLGSALPRAVPLKATRIAAAALFLLVGFVIAVSALRLV